LLAKLTQSWQGGSQRRKISAVCRGRDDAAAVRGAGNDGWDAEARAAAGRELLANAIAGTRGSYLVYKFGGRNPTPMPNAGGSWYEMTSGGHLMIIKPASQRVTPRLLVDSHSGYQSRCERDPRARTGEGLFQASETYSPLQAWQALGQPTIEINANFFDIRRQKGGSWKSTACSSPLGAYVDNTRGQGRANAPPRSPTPGIETRCTSSRAAATRPTRSRISSAGWAATPRDARKFVMSD
jgi:hypothetical protein